DVARGDRARVRAVVASAFWLYAGLAAVAVVIGLAVAPWLPRALGIQPALQQTASWLIALTGLQVGVALGLIPPSALLRGLQRYDLYNMLVAANAVLEAT